MKINRLISIIIVLLDMKRISAKELANMFEVSVRTIYRDIETISMAGIPVHSISGIGGGFEIMENYRLDKKTFTETDIENLLIGISSMPDLLKNKDIAHTITKIKSMVPKDNFSKIYNQTDQIHIDYNQWTINRNLKNEFNLITKALHESKILSFEYVNHKGEKLHRQVEPYQLVLKGVHWYLQGYCYIRNEFRLFKLVRMINIEIKDANFIPRKLKQPILDINEMIEPLEVTIKLRIHISVMDRLLDFCSYEKFEKENNDYYTVDFTFIENEYYYNMLLSFGEQCEVLRPQHIRNELKKKIENLSKVYYL